MNKKGFTLIELLAVIIILAIVALIATPIVLNVVDDAKKSTAQSEAQLVVSGVETGCALRDMKKQMLTGDEATTFAVCGTSVSGEDVKTLELVNLGKATIKTALTLTKGKVTGGVIVSNGYEVTVGADGTLTVAKPTA